VPDIIQSQLDDHDLDTILWEPFYVDIKPEWMDEQCLAPQLNATNAGANQKKRETGHAPERLFQKPVACSRCGIAGHNMRNKRCPAYRTTVAGIY